jgi:WhiB family transcriptional regulator, redox-sensing transcriptional regulator
MAEAAVAEPHWYEDAACRGQGWERFFDHTDPTTAQRICARCPVRAPCLRFAMANQIDTGVWGGLTPEQRRRTRASTLVA